MRPNSAQQQFGGLGEARRRISPEAKGFARCETETAGAVESTVPQPSRSGCNRTPSWVGSLSLGR